LSNPAAAAAAALRAGNRLLWGTSCWEFFRHQILLGRHGNHLSGQLLYTIREECKPPATTKPIAETYLEESSTSQRNGSTEVLQKERSGLCKTSGGLPIERGTFLCSPIKTTRRVPQVRSLNLGLGVAFFSTLPRPFQEKGHRDDSCTLEEIALLLLESLCVSHGFFALVRNKLRINSFSPPKHLLMADEVLLE
jgi:hypothetical protein